MEALHVVDLFSGISGFSKGAESAGAKLVLAIEKDPKIAEIYAKNFDHAPRVQTLTHGNLDSLVQEIRQFDRDNLCGRCCPFFFRA